MAMADKIAVMNHGVIEQFGTPQEIYDRPATMFVADFIGSPPMNFLPFDGGLATGATRDASCDGATVAVPEVREDVAPSASWCSACGPSTSASTTRRSCAARSSAPNISAPRRSSRSRPRTAWSRRALPADMPRAHAASRSGSRFDAERLSLFEQASGRAIRTALHDGGRVMAEVALDGVTKRFGDDRGGRRDLDLDIADGEFVVLLGPTGAGKTTTLRLVAGLERPDAGTIRIGGRDVTRARAGGARRRLRLPAIFALSAPVGVRQPRLPAALAGAAHAGGRDPAPGRARSPSCCASTDKLEQPRDRSCPAARCSASRSAARWCASRRST